MFVIPIDCANTHRTHLAMSVLTSRAVFLNLDPQVRLISLSARLGVLSQVCLTTPSTCQSNIDPSNCPEDVLSPSPSPSHLFSNL